MGWTTPRTWVAGEKPSAATLNLHIRDNLNALNGFVRKTADESVTSSATLQNDNHLTLSIPAAGTYIIDLRLFASSAANAAGDLQVGFTFPAGTMHVGYGVLANTLASGSSGTAEFGASLSVASGAAAAGIGLSTTVTHQIINAIFIATASGTLQVQWAQLASNASASTVKAGSYMTMRQVA